MYIRFISLEMFITDKGGFWTHAVFLSINLLDSLFFLQIFRQRNWIFQLQWIENGGCKESSDVDHAGQFLHPVEKDVSLLDALLILSVLAVRPVGYHDPPHLVNLSVKPATGNEPAQLLVHVSLGHTEGVCHVGKSEGAIRLQQLSIGFHLDLPDVVGIMGRQVAICFHNLFQLAKSCEEVAVLAIVQREQVVPNLWRLVKHLQDLASLYHVLVQIRPVQSKDRDPDGVLDKLYVVHQFVAGES